MSGPNAGVPASTRSISKRLAAGRRRPGLRQPVPQHLGPRLARRRQPLPHCLRQGRPPGRTRRSRAIPAGRDGRSQKASAGTTKYCRSFISFNCGRAAPAVPAPTRPPPAAPRRAAGRSRGCGRANSTCSLMRIVVEVLERRLGGARRQVEPVGRFAARRLRMEDQEIRHDAGLGGDGKGLAPLARRQVQHVLRGQVVQEAPGLGAGQFELAAVRLVEDDAARPGLLVLPKGIAEVGGDGPAAFVREDGAGPRRPRSGAEWVGP